MYNRTPRIVAACIAIAMTCLFACAFVSMESFSPILFQVTQELPAESDARVSDALPDAEFDEAESGGVASGEVAESGDVPLYEAGTVLVTLEEGVSSERALEVLGRETGLDGLDLVEVESDFAKIALPEGVEVDEALSLMQGSSVVASSQPNFYYYIQEDGAASGVSGESDAAGTTDLKAVQIEEATSVVNDPYASRQWALDAINVSDAWDYLLDLGKIYDEPLADGAVGVAVIDEGFNVGHEDLKNVVAVRYNAVDGGTDVSETVGQGGHGTHVAGIVAAQTDNETGVAGVSHNAKLMLVKVCDDEGSMTTDVLVKGYDRIMALADAYNIRVINVSLGGCIPPDSQTEYDKLLLSKIDEAFELGLVTVCSAGNATSRCSVPYYNYPSDYATCVSVINVDSTAKRYSTSNYNDPETGETGKNISAPGASVYSSYSNGGYSTKTGTSMASPHVAGVLALMFAAAPGLTAEEAVSKLYSTARDLQYTSSTEVAGKGWDCYTGYGLVDAAAAVDSTLFFITGDTAVDVGGSTQLSCKMTTDELTWSSSDEGVATISASGLLTGVSEGQATITVSDGAHTALQLVTVNTPTITGPDELICGGEAVCRVDSVVDGDWTWTTSDPKVATVNSTGKVSSVGAGDTVIKAVSIKNKDIVAAYTLTVDKASQSMKIVTTSKTIKASKAKKKRQKLGKLVKAKRAKGKVTCEKLSGNKKIIVKENGKVVVKKNIAWGTYKVCVRVKAAGNANYEPATQSASFVICVK